VLVAEIEPAFVLPGVALADHRHGADGEQLRIVAGDDRLVVEQALKHPGRRMLVGDVPGLARTDVVSL